MAPEQQVSLLPGHVKSAVCRLGQHQGGRLSRNLYKFWYTNGVAGPEVIQVHPVSEVRARLSSILARFRREGSAASLSPTRRRECCTTSSGSAQPRNRTGEAPAVADNGFDIYHLRDRAGAEVDFILEGPGGQVVGIEI